MNKRKRAFIVQRSSQGLLHTLGGPAGADVAVMYRRNKFSLLYLVKDTKKAEAKFSFVVSRTHCRQVGHSQKRREASPRRHCIAVAALLP